MQKSVRTGPHPEGQCIPFCETVDGSLGRRGFLATFCIASPTCSWRDNGQVAPIDALSIINYLNSLPPGTHTKVEPTAAIGKPYGYLDTSGENDIAPLDALLVINHLNAIKAIGEGEDTTLTPNKVQIAPGSALADIISLLAMDVAEQGKRRRSAP